MLRDESAGPIRELAAVLTSRLIVEPRRTIVESVLPAADLERAAANAAAAGVPTDLLPRFGATVRQTHRRANVVVVDVPADQQAALAAALEAAGIPARPPLPVQPLLNDSVPLLHVPPLWHGGLRGTGVRIAIVDTGIDATHPDLAGRIAAHADFSGAGEHDDVGHGTHVAGIVAGAGAVYRGVAPAATLVVAKALSTAGGSADAVLAAMSWASRQDVAVMNLSLGGPGSPTSPLAREVDGARGRWDHRVRRGGERRSRARHDQLTWRRARRAHGRRDGQGRRGTFYSSQGPVSGARYRKPDVLAIGGGVTRGAACSYGTGIASARAAVLGADPCVVPPRYVRMSGTSMATPHVAGICALLVEAVGPGDPLVRAGQVRRALVRSARPIRRTTRDETGAGLVDAERALAAITQKARSTA